MYTINRKQIQATNNVLKAKVHNPSTNLVHRSNKVIAFNQTFHSYNEISLKKVSADNRQGFIQPISSQNQSPASQKILTQLIKIRSSIQKLETKDNKHPRIAKEIVIDLGNGYEITIKDLLTCLPFQLSDEACSRTGKDLVQEDNSHVSELEFNVDIQSSNSHPSGCQHSDTCIRQQQQQLPLYRCAGINDDVTSRFDCSSLASEQQQQHLHPLLSSHLLGSQFSCKGTPSLFNLSCDRAENNPNSCFAEGLAASNTSTPLQQQQQDIMRENSSISIQQNPQSLPGAQPSLQKPVLDQSLFVRSQQCNGGIWQQCFGGKHLSNEPTEGRQYFEENKVIDETQQEMPCFGGSKIESEVEVEGERQHVLNKPIRKQAKGKTLLKGQEQQCETKRKILVR